MLMREGKMLVRFQAWSTRWVRKKELTNMAVNKPNTRVIRSKSNSKVPILWKKRNVPSRGVSVVEGLRCVGNTVGRVSLS